MRVFFDGACPICTQAVSWISRKRSDSGIEYIDIEEAIRLKRAPAGLTANDLLRRIHIVDNTGRVLAGPDAIGEICRQSKMAWLATMLQAPGIKYLSAAAYRIFARHRHRLSKLL